MHDINKNVKFTKFWLRQTVSAPRYEHEEGVLSIQLLVTRVDTQ